MPLAAVDLAILIIYLVGTVAFGLWLGRGSRTAAGFMVGDRDLPWYAVLFSIVATETSTVTFLSTPGIGWASSLEFLQLPIGYCIGRLLIVAFLLPRYFRGQLFTAYEVLNERFGGAVKQVAALLFISTRTLADAVRLYLGALLLQQLVDISMWHAALAIGVTTIVYTLSGGMRAVVWTDFIQFIVYIAGAAIAFTLLCSQLDGGLLGLWDQASTAGKLHVFDFSFDPGRSYTFWSGVLAAPVFAVGTHGADQMMVQRYLCARNQRDAGWALALSGPVVVAQFAFFLLIGTALWAFYESSPALAQLDPSLKDDRDRIFGMYIVEHLPLGVLGIVLGAVFSAAMSTLSSSLSSSATSLLSDIWVPSFRPTSSDRERLATIQWFTAGFGVVQVLVAIVGNAYLERSALVTVLTIQGATTGLLLGLFVLALTTKHADARAALVGLLVGATGVGFVAFCLEPATGFRVAWPYFPVIGATLTAGAGAASSR